MRAHSVTRGAAKGNKDKDLREAEISKKGD